MRSPCQHPSRKSSGKSGGADLELALPTAAAKPKPKGAAPAVARREPPKEARGRKPAAKQAPAGTKRGAAARGQGRVGAGDGPPPSNRRPQKQRAKARAPAVVAGPAVARSEPQAAAASISQRGAAPTPPAATAGAAFGEEIDHAEIAALADYGPDPDNIIAAVRYALKVRKRRATLQKLHAKQHKTHENALRAIREQTADVVEELVEAAEQSDSIDSQALSDIMAPIAKAEELMAKRAAAVGSTANQFAATNQAIDGQLGELREQRDARARERDAAQTRLEEAIANKTRHANQLEMLESELAAAHEQARTAAGKGAQFAPPEHATRIAELEAKLAQAREPAKAHAEAMQAARDELKVRAQALSAATHQMSSVDKQRATADQQAGDARDMHIEAMREGHASRLLAYERALERIAAEQAQTIDDEAHERIEGLRRARSVNDADLRKFALAVDAYNESAYRQGLLTLGVAAALAVVLLLVFARVG